MNSDKLTSLIKALRNADYTFSAEDLLDAIYLSSHLPKNTKIRPKKLPETPPKDQVKERENDSTDDNHSKKEQKDASEHGKQNSRKTEKPPVNVRTQSTGEGATVTERQGVTAKLPGAGGLDHALQIGRSLRPFRRRRETDRFFELDERKTAEQIAASDIWLPVVNPGKERWLDATIVLDAGGSMSIWRNDVYEFRRIIETLGAFRRVETVWLDSDDASWNDDSRVPLFAQERGMISRRRPLSIVDSSQRRFIIVISDCVGHAWWNGHAVRLLDKWGAVNHCTILHLLPRSIWEQTAIGSAFPVTMRSPRPLCPNRQTATYTESFLGPQKLQKKDATSIPILEMQPRSIEKWCQWITGDTDRDFPAQCFLHNLKRASVNSDVNKELGEPFLTFATPQARKLASIMSVIPPFNLPLLRIVSESTLNEHVTRPFEAEFLLGGIVKAVGGKEQRFERPDDVLYDFQSPELRAHFRMSVPHDLVKSLLRREQVSDYLSKRLGLDHSFAAILDSPDNYCGALASKTREVTDPIAQFSSDIVTWLGDEYRTLVHDVSSDHKENQEELAMSIRVVGSGRTLRSEKRRQQFASFCNELGREIARRGYGIVTVNYKTDTYVASGFSEIETGGQIVHLEEGKRRKKAIPHFLRRRDVSVKQRFVESAIGSGAVRVAEAVIAIGDGKMVDESVAAAFSEGKPVLALPIFGGIAAQLTEQTLAAARSAGVSNDLLDGFENLKWDLAELPSLALDVLEKWKTELGVANLGESSTDDEEPTEEDLPRLVFKHDLEDTATAFQWSPDGFQLAVPCLSGMLQVLTLGRSDLQSIRSPERVSSEGLNQVSWSGPRILVACHSKKAKLVDLESLHVSQSFRDHSSDVVRVAWSPNGDHFATGSAGGTLRIWDVSTGRIVFSQNRPATRVQDLCWISGNRIVVVYENATVVYRNVTGNVKSESQDVGAYGVALVTAAFPWLEEAPVLALGTAEGTVEFRSIPNLERVGEPLTLFDQSLRVSSLSVSSDGRLLAGKSREGHIAVMDMRRRKRIHLIDSNESGSPHTWLAFRPNSHQLALTDNKDRQLQLIDFGYYFQKEQIEKTNSIITTALSESDFVVVERRLREAESHTPNETLIGVPLAGDLILLASRAAFQPQEEVSLVPFQNSATLSRARFAEGIFSIGEFTDLSTEFKGAFEIGTRSESNTVDTEFSIVLLMTEVETGQSEFIEVPARVTENGSVISSSGRDVFDHPAQPSWVIHRSSSQQQPTIIGIVTKDARLVPISDEILAEIELVRDSLNKQTSSTYPGDGITLELFSHLEGEPDRGIYDEAVSIISENVRSVVGRIDFLRLSQATSEASFRHAVATILRQYTAFPVVNEYARGYLDRERSPTVLSAIIQALAGYVRDPYFKESIESSFRENLETECTSVILDTLEASKLDNELLKALARRLENEPEPRLRWRIVEILLDSRPDQSILDILRKHLESEEDEDVREAFQNALAKYTRTGDEPRHWICVTGSGEHELDQPALDACRAIGHALAVNRFGLVTGGYPGVDYVTAEAFFAKLSADQVPNPERYLKHVSSSSEEGKPNFEYGEHLKVSAGDYKEALLENSEAVIMISGRAGADRLAREALTRGMPVLPIVGTGERTDRLYEFIFENWSTNRTFPITRFQFRFLSNRLTIDEELATYLSWLVEPPKMQRVTQPLQIMKDVLIEDRQESYSRWVTTVQDRVLRASPRFRLALTPVTCGQFYEFVKAGGYDPGKYMQINTLSVGTFEPLAPPGIFNDEDLLFERLDHPVAGISYVEAVAYCKWLNEWNPRAGWRWQIPTEDMWEYAARLSGKQHPTRYPWGNDDSKIDSLCNSREAGNGGTTSTAIDRSEAATPDGCIDMAGNVWEFVEEQETCILRGGSYVNDRRQVKSSLRLFGVDPMHRAPDFGFRIALVEVADG